MFLERWLSGRKRPPRKRLFHENGIVGSNPTLSSNLRSYELRLARPVHLGLILNKILVEKA